jgi:hypothetical protein
VIALSSNMDNKEGIMAYRKMNKTKSGIVLVLFLLFPIISWAACTGTSNYDCVPCTQGETGDCRQPKDLTLANVQAAVTASAAGNGSEWKDGVYLIAGTTTWSSSLVIDKSGLVFKGAGSSSTTINISTNYGIIIDKTRTRISGMYFKPTYCAIASGNLNLRIDNNRFTGGSCPIMLNPGRLVTGVIDSNTFDGTGVGSYILLRAPDDGKADEWLKPIDFGSDKWLFVEDNTFNVSSNDVEAIENNWGGKFVVRHNTFNEVYGYNMTTIFEMHNVSCPAPISGQSGNGRAYIAHDNRLNFTTPPNDWRRILYWRGGTGLFYNNIIDYSGRGTESGIVYFQLHSYRAASSCDDGSTNTGNCSAPSLGTRMLARCCATDYHPNGAGTYPQGEGYPCLDAPGSGVWGGTREPVYFWNNKKTGDGGATLVDINSAGGVSLDPSIQWAVALNRDYCVSNGASQPTSCGGVALNYIPYTYPHPLRTGNFISAPQSLRIQ